MLSKKSKYGLKALLVLSQEAGRGPVLISEISRREAIPVKFLEAILCELKRRGVVESRKGKGGGYALARMTTTYGDRSDAPNSEYTTVLLDDLAAITRATRTAARKSELRRTAG